MPLRKAIGTKMMQWWCNTQVWYHCQQKINKYFTIELKDNKSKSMLRKLIITWW